MCNGSFKESLEQQIELPDDDADIFGRVLEYMYRGVFDGFETPTQNVKVAMLADLYILAEKYQLSGLKKLLIPPLATILDDASEAECIECFFHAARKIYENTPDSEVLFPDSFKETMTKMLSYSDRAPCMEAQIKLTIYGGGKLAQDAFDAYYTHIDNAHTTANKLMDAYEENAKAQLRNQVDIIQTKHDALAIKAQTFNSAITTFEAHHSALHPHCNEPLFGY